jgi:hypothetical protein
VQCRSRANQRAHPADSQGVVNGQRFYQFQLIRQNGAITDRTFEIRFLDPGVEAYAFTFGSTYQPDLDEGGRSCRPGVTLVDRGDSAICLSENGRT